MRGVPTSENPFHRPFSGNLACWGGCHHWVKPWFQREWKDPAVTEVL
jgi:hypothetical protein